MATSSTITGGRVEAIEINHALVPSSAMAESNEAALRRIAKSNFLIERAPYRWWRARHLQERGDVRSRAQFDREMLRAELIAK